MEITKNPLFMRSIIFGIGIGILYYVFRRFVHVDYDLQFIFALVFCGVFAFLNYKYIGIPLFGLISGLLGIFTLEFLGTLTGGIPFISIFRWFGILPFVYLIPTLSIWVITPISGFLGAYIAFRRNGPVFDYGQSTINVLEKKVLDYIKNHNNQIRISECALDLDLKESEVQETINSLQKKGLLLNR